nr:replication initiation protein [Cressdnaviricota sp.]
MGFDGKADGIPFPCGQCLSCRINKRRVWTLRLMLENYYHEKACFVTLTYRDDDLPFDLCSGVPVLEKRDCQLWLKRLRKRFNGTEVRYYLAGEYGTRSKRPHYHAILFGIGPEQLDPQFFLYGGKSGGEKGLEKRVTPLSKTWSFGLVHVGEVTRQSIQYVAGYVTKKFTKKGDGYVPEFSLMSRRPGIGSQAVGQIAAVLQQYNLEERTQRQLRIDGKKWPLGRYLLDKLSDVLGVEFGTDDYVRELSRYWAESRRSGLSFVDFLVQQDAGKYALLEAKDKIYNKRIVL